MIVVFLGPTLPLDEARRELDATYRPPVTQGDVYRAALSKPEAIVIVDGEFDQVPAVWHKEILWAMSEGIHVYGASSMGALRAAELCSFGMIGVGKIFEAYRDGQLEDDDEVAVAHASASFGHRQLSEAMFDIRCTLCEAERCGIISPETRSQLETIAKKLYFPHRSYAAMLRGARDAECNRDEIDAFETWLPTNAIDQKRGDALAVLRLVREHQAHGFQPRKVAYTFRHTTYWQHLLEAAEHEHASDEIPAQAVLEELWLDPEACVAAHHAALVRHLLVQPSQQLPEMKQYASHLLEELQASGKYHALLEQAKQKQSVLESNGFHNRGEGDEEIETEVLFDWHLNHPENGNGTAAFLRLARANWRGFMRALVRQHYYESADAVDSSRLRL